MYQAELKVLEFINLLASKEPAPGGGAAAALAGALGSALACMVCSLTRGKEAYAAHQELAAQAQDKALDLTASFLDLMDRDADAFWGISAAYKLPKGTPEEKQARTAAIQRELKACTEPPMAMMELAAETLELTASLLGKSNRSAVSDLGVSALALGAAIRSAWLNVLINIGGMQDKELAGAYRARGEALLERALPLAEQIYQEVAAAL
jgi:formiminotetrahydrofolate cyclodeaminase